MSGKQCSFVSSLSFGDINRVWGGGGDSLAAKQLNLFVEPGRVDEIASQKGLWAALT